MTSGKFKSVPLGSIFVDREQRQRKELKDIDGLAASIAAIGLINPLVVEKKTMRLVAGERRLTACRQLGWTSIPVQWAEDLDETELQTIELEENIKRLDLTWQEQADAIRRYHHLKSENEPWSMDKTADALGLARSSISHWLGVAEALAKGDQTVKAAPQFSTARNIVERQRQRKKNAELASVTKTMEDLGTAPAKAAPTVPLVNTEFNQNWIDCYGGPRITFLHCDFPYGINAGEHDQGGGKEFGGYEDSFENYMGLVNLIPADSPLFADECHLMFWFSMDYYEVTRVRLTELGWKVDPFPFIWHKVDNRGILPDPQRGPRRIYETAFFATKGDPKVVKSVSNCVGLPTAKEIHMSEKPRPMLHHFMRMLVDSHTNMLDPTCGSGNAVRVAKELGANSVLGLERDPEFHARAIEAWDDRDA